jgi:hypothetical protein
MPGLSCSGECVHGQMQRPSSKHRLEAFARVQGPHDGAVSRSSFPRTHHCRSCLDTLHRCQVTALAAEHNVDANPPFAKAMQ